MDDLSFGSVNFVENILYSWKYGSENIPDI